MSSKLKFVQLTLSEYNNLSTKDSGTLYFITTSPNRIYKGNTLFGRSDSPTTLPTSASFSSLSADYINASQLYGNGGYVATQEWVQQQISSQLDSLLDESY